MPYVFKDFYIAIRAVLSRKRQSGVSEYGKIVFFCFEKKSLRHYNVCNQGQGEPKRREKKFPRAKIYSPVRQKKERKRAMNASQESWQKFLRYHRRMLYLMLGVCAAAAAAFLIASGGDRSWTGGFVLGATAQVLKFGVLDLAVIRGVAAGNDRVARTQVMNMFFSLALFGLAALVTLRLDFSVWALAAGIFLPRLVLLADAKLRPNPFNTVDAERNGDSPER